MRKTVGQYKVDVAEERITAFVPSVVGLIIAGEVIKDILEFYN